MKLFITGGTGFIGTHLVKRLAQTDHELVCLVRKSSNVEPIKASGATLVTRTSGGSEMFGMHILIKDRYLLEGELNGAAEMLHGRLESGTPMTTSASGTGASRASCRPVRSTSPSTVRS